MTFPLVCESARGGSSGNSLITPNPGPHKDRTSTDRISYIPIPMVGGGHPLTLKQPPRGGSPHWVWG